MTRTTSDLAPLLPELFDALSHAGIGLEIIADRDGVMEWWYANEPVANLFGYTVTEMLAIPPLDLVVPEQRALVDQLSEAVRGGQAVPPMFEMAGIHKDGTHVALELSIGYVALPNRTVAYLLVVRDTCKAASQLTLLEADRIGLVGALAAGFAHEINNPLTSVLLNLRSLRKHIDTPPALRCLDDVTTGAERIASNVRALQTLATRSASQEIDLAAVVSSSLRLAAPTVEPRAHVIRQIFPVRLVIGEESRIGQAVLAMMLFSCSGFEDSVVASSNRIVVAVEERDDDVVIEVSDNGRDLSPEETRRAFDPFFRSPSRGAGVGVGLGVARSVAAGMGGEVRLSARPGGGAVVTMRLPAAR